MNALIVLNYNDFNCIYSFVTKVKKYKILDKIIVVDNGSTEEIFKQTQLLANNKVEVISSSKNGGYGYGNNCGIKYVLKKYPNANLIVSNPDVIVEEKVIEELINCLKKDDVDVIAPVIKENLNVIRGRKLINIWQELITHFPFVYKNKLKSSKSNYLFYGDNHYKTRLSYVDMVHGCFFAIKGKVIQDIDYYDENMFLYYEEEVLATKLKKKGYKTAILNEVSVIHQQSVTINKLYSEIKKERIKNKSRKYFYKCYKNEYLSDFVLFIVHYMIIFKIIFSKIYTKLKKIWDLIKIYINICWNKYHFLIPPKKLVKGIKHFIRILNSQKENSYKVTDMVGYASWINKNEKPVNYKEFLYNPFISIVIPHYNTDVEWLRQCLNSLLNQSYKNFEICIADDCSTNKESLELLRQYEKKYSQIKVVYRKKNGNISQATNSAIEIAQGDFIGFMDSDDVLSHDALYWIVNALNNDKNLDVIYTDEDKLDFNGTRCYPNFKPDFSPDPLLVINYICHFTVIRKEIMVKSGTLKSKYDGAQDHEYLLRVTEKTKKIHHIPRILYHWRMIPGSTSVVESEKPYVLEARKKVIEDTIKRRNLKATLSFSDMVPNYFNILFANDNEKVSIIIPTRDHVEYLKPCIESIYEKTTYKNFELVLIDHCTKEKDALDFIKQCKEKYKNFHVIKEKGEFNYSYLVNQGAKIATGEYFIMLNSDTEIITPEWIEIMLGYARLEHIGCVGAKLLYPDNTIQHAGVVLLGKNIAGHTMVGLSDKDPGISGRLAFPYNYSAVTFACAMVSKQKYFDIDGLDEELPAAYNDVDFCLKLLKKGYYNVYMPNVRLYHYESKIRGLDITSKNYPRFLKAVNLMNERWEKELHRDIFRSRYSYDADINQFIDHEVDDGEE